MQKLRLLAFFTVIFMTGLAFAGDDMAVPTGTRQQRVMGTAKVQPAAPSANPKKVAPNATLGTSLYANDGVTLLDNSDVKNSYILAPAKNLRIRTSSLTSYGGTVTITADSITVTDYLGNNFLVPDVSTGLSGTLGAGGFDIIPGVSNAWYYIHAIYNGTTVSALASLSATNPTLPLAYSTGGHGVIGICYVYGTGSANPYAFDGFQQIGNIFWVGVPANYTLTTSLHSGSYANLPHVPVSIAGAALLKCDYTGATAISDLDISLDGTNIWAACSSLTGFAGGHIETWVPVVGGSPYAQYETGATGTVAIYLKAFILNI
jgi:hypothetical protein